MRIFPIGIERKLLTRIADRWGLAGSGILYFCPDDNTILLLHRSNKVEDPGLWGIPGGAVRSGRGNEEKYHEEDEEAPEYSEDELRETAFTETVEELGHLPEHNQEQSYHTTLTNNFPFTTFLVVVTLEQKNTISRKIQLNWENDDHDWFRVDFLPENIHPGVEIAIQQLINKERQLQLAI